MYHLYYATELRESKQELDENEFVEVVMKSMDEIDIFSLEDPKTIIALSYYKEKYMK